MEEMDVETMQQMLRRHLHDKTYFIVLDDVWDDTCAKYVLPCLPENDSSRVLLTARSSSITNQARFGINMGHQNSRQSWQLFMKMVSNGYYKCPKHLEKIGRKIVKKCNGLPLAIKEAGMQLARLSQSESVWQEYMESMNLSVTAKTLELSYHRLSPKLKSCFVHMSFFKEGKDIRAVKLFHIWNIARMVRQCKVAGNEILMEETARINLSYLSDDNMIMNKHSTMYGKIKSFDVDDFLHKISILKAEQEISFEILRNEEHCGRLCKPRHRAIYCSRKRFNYTTNQDKYLLSLFLHGFGSFDASPSYWENFEQLRILDFEGFGLKTLPEMVCTLGRLRYLGLRDNHIQELSHTLVRLKNLEVLDVAHNFMIEVPNIICEMDSLRHLYMSDIICRTPLMIDSLKNLQSLKYISVNNWMHELSNLGKMTSLRKLGIHELDENTDIPRLFASLAKLKSLEYLILRGFCFRSMPPLDDFSGLDGLIQIKLIGRLTRLPKFPKNIRLVRLVNSCLPKDAEKEDGVEGRIRGIGTNMKKGLYYQY